MQEKVKARVDKIEYHFCRLWCLLRIHCLHLRLNHHQQLHLHSKPQLSFLRIIRILCVQSHAPQYGSLSIKAWLPNLWHHGNNFVQCRHLYWLLRYYQRQFKDLFNIVWNVDLTAHLCRDRPENILTDTLFYHFNFDHNRFVEDQSQSDQLLEFLQVSKLR